MLRKKMILALGLSFVAYGASASAQPAILGLKATPTTPKIIDLSNPNQNFGPSITLDNGESIEVTLVDSAIPTRFRYIPEGGVVEGLCDIEQVIADPKNPDDPNDDVIVPYCVKSIAQAEKDQDGVWDVVYLWTEKRVFDQWGESDCDDGVDQSGGLNWLNGYDQESQDFSLTAESRLPVMESNTRFNLFWTPQASPQGYQPDADPVCLLYADRQFLEDIYYVAFRSECSLDNSEKSPLCPAYRLEGMPGESHLAGFANDKGFKVQAVELDGDKVTPMNVPMSTYPLLKKKSEVLKIKIK